MSLYTSALAACEVSIVSLHLDFLESSTKADHDFLCKANRLSLLLATVWRGICQFLPTFVSAEPMEGDLLIFSTTVSR